MDNKPDLEPEPKPLLHKKDKEKSFVGLAWHGKARILCLDSL
jgi:hypothetical protein